MRRNISQYIDFLPKAQELVKRMSNQGAEKRHCYFSLKKLVNKHTEDFSKYGINIELLLNEMLLL